MVLYAKFIFNNMKFHVDVLYISIYLESELVVTPTNPTCLRLCISIWVSNCTERSKDTLCKKHRSSTVFLYIFYLWI